MVRHPGGENHTRRLLALAGFEHGACVLDMGAGDGSAVQLMRAMGLCAEGIDLHAETDGHTAKRGGSYICAGGLNDERNGLCIGSDGMFAGQDDLRRKMNGLCTEHSSRPPVVYGDFLHTDYPSASFDGVLTQCAFHVSGDALQAFCESARLLRPGGVLLFSDVWFDGEAALRAVLAKNGFELLALEDETAAWKEYYIEAIWNGTMELPPAGTGKCRYYSLAAKKRGA